MALNHTVVAETKQVEQSKSSIIDTNKNDPTSLNQTYNACSPDELSLVNAAKFFGFTFLGKDEKDFLEVNLNGSKVKYKLLNLIEFDSTRKRMTSILRDPNDEIIVMCKGADSVILPLIKNKEKLEVNQLIQ